MIPTITIKTIPISKSVEWFDEDEVAIVVSRAVQLLIDNSNAINAINILKP
jgi:hypothetical protein